jgi:SAM-dependent methyltransferase
MTLDKDPKERLKWIYKAEGVEDLQSRYDLWAEEYEKDVSSYGYKIPAVVAGFLGRYLRPIDGTILDAGAGTGIMGEMLSLLSYQEMVAIDISPGMLELAKQKGIYREIHQMTLGKHLDFPDDFFAGVIATGVLSIGHAPPESFSELIRCTRPGGIIIFSVRADAAGFKNAQDELEKAKKWQLIEETAPFTSLPLGEPDIQHKVFVYRVI